MTLNIKALADKFAQLSGEKKKTSYPTLPFWKPTLNEDGKPRSYNIRILPFDFSGQPFCEIGYYDNKKLNRFRLVAPVQFGMEDPIAEFVQELRKDRSNKGAWNTIKGLLPQSRFYAPILVREEKEKGVQIYEMSRNLCKKFYANFLDEEFASEPLNDAMVGRDFKITVSPSGKTFTNEATGKSYPVNDVEIRVATKSSKLLPTQEEVDKLLASAPKLMEYFRSQVKSADELGKMLRNYLNIDAESVAGTPEMEEGADDAVLKSIEDQFDGL